MTTDVLLIFINNPHGSATLSRSLGELNAWEINEKLETAILAATQGLLCRKIIFHPNDKAIYKLWENEKYQAEIQVGKHLNTKIEHAFSKYIIENKEEITKAVFITADCPRLTQQIIEKAFESLNKYDVCIGPEKKGGYYLMGMKEPMPFLFANKLWSGDHLLDDTLEELIHQGKKYFLLPELQGVNDIYDLHLLK